MIKITPEMIQKNQLTDDMKAHLRDELARRKAAREQQDPSHASQEMQPPEQQQLSNPQNLLLRGGADFLAGIVQAGQGIESTPYNLAKTLGASPQTLSYFPQPTNIDTGKAFGVQDPNIVDKIIQGIGTYVPAAALGGSSILGQGLAGATTGFTQSKNPILGAAEGGVGGAALPIVGKGIGLAAKSIGPMIKSLTTQTPKNITENILSDLGGNRNLESNALSLAKDIKKAARTRYNEAQSMYNPVFEQVGDKELLPANFLENVDSESLDTSGLRKMNDVFLKNPTFQNAHWLQSQLGHELRKLNSPDAATVAKADLYNDAKNNIKQDMMDFLKNNSPDLHNQYLKAQEHYAKNYVPYKETATIKDIIKDPKDGNIESPFATYEKRKISPQSIVSALKNPTLNANTAKIAGDLPGKSFDKIIYSELGKSSYKKPITLANAINKLDEKGLSSYLSDDTLQKINTLSDAIKYRKYGWRGLAALGLASTGGLATLKHFTGQ